MKSIQNIGDIKGKTVFVRVDYNVPVINGSIADDFRIIKSFATIDYLREQGANIILGSHRGEGSDTLEPIAVKLQEKYPVAFVSDYFPNTPDFQATFAEGKIVLLENLRKYPGEKANDEAFAKHLASFAEIYVDEAFPCAHRQHASIVGVPKYIPGFAGFAFQDEVANLSKVFNAPHPFVFILGGAKFETKLPLVQKFFPKVDTLFVGGALANDFLKAKGLGTGASLLSQGNFDLQKYFSDKLVLPTDVVVKHGGEKVAKDATMIAQGDVVCDVGPQSIEHLKPILMNAQCIVWNGPLGNYENGFKDATLALAKIVAESGAESIVGGGDTTASIAELNLGDKFTFISTAGGAMLEFLAQETLPGIEALN